MKKVMIIKADENDADIVSSETDVTNKPDLIQLIKEKIVPILKENRHHNWDMNNYGDKSQTPYVKYKDRLSEDEIERFNSYVPFGTGDYPIRSIESISVITITEEEIIF